jgi:hypothetical protein
MREEKIEWLLRDSRLNDLGIWKINFVKIVFT